MKRHYEHISGSLASRKRIENGMPLLISVATFLCVALNFKYNNSVIIKVLKQNNIVVNPATNLSPPFFHRFCLRSNNSSSYRLTDYSFSHEKYNRHIMRATSFPRASVFTVGLMLLQ